MSYPRETYLLVWFYRQNKKSMHDVCSGAIVNIVISQIDPPFCHVELAFEDGMAISVTKNHKVCMRQRSFDPLHYTCIKIPVSLEVSIYAKSEASARVGQPFGYVGNDTTFCSKLVCEILKTSMAVDGLGSPSLTSPSGLYKRLIVKGKLVYPCSKREAFPIGFKNELTNLLPESP
jgi:hypothetical protein